MNEKLDYLKKKANGLPTLPGVYIMKDSGGKIIYIGKAKKLKNRVSQYFGSDKRHEEKVRRMVSHVNDFEYIICDSEFEALILECSMIKQYSPKYNILLKDDKGFHYIRVSKEEWPTIKEVKQYHDDEAEYIGPYNSGWILKQTVEEASKVFKLPQCSKQFPRDYKKSRPCLNYHIGNCSAPCAGKITHGEYLESIRSALQLIKGGSDTATEQMRDRMTDAAERLDFELAAKLRDRINAIEKTRQRQKVMTSTYKRQDVVGSARTEKTTCFTVFVFQNGRLSDCEQFILNDAGDLVTARTEFIKRYYSLRTDVPPRVAFDGEIEDSDLIAAWLKEKSGHTVSLAVPQKGEQLELVKMCSLNAAEYLAKYEQRGTSQTAALDELARLLSLKNPPRYIEAYDISHTAGDENVAGMTVFYDAAPLKSAYKRFKIKSFSGQDDTRSMAEVLTRRFTEYQSHKESGEGFGRLPDLILLDGGKGQLGAVLPVLEAFGLNVPVFGMVKDSKHKTRAIAASGGDIAIKANRRAYTLISTIQEETHRFAIEYHRRRSTKKGLATELCEVEGVGPARAKQLLKVFKTVAAIRAATTEELCEKAKIPKKIAENILQYYN